MQKKKREQVKIVVLVLVSIVFVIVGYFRFTHKKPGAVKNQPPARIQPGQPAISPVSITIPQPTRIPESTGVEPMPAVTRDIFSPMETGSPGKPLSGSPDVSQSPPDLDLEGTIVGGEKPMAIINNQFLGVGQWIAGYQVMRIGKNGVLLVSGNRKIELEMAKDE
jgi:hypothetical protein